MAIHLAVLSVRHRQSMSRIWEQTATCLSLSQYLAITTPLTRGGCSALQSHASHSINTKRTTWETSWAAAAHLSVQSPHNRAMSTFGRFS